MKLFTKPYSFKIRLLLSIAAIALAFLITSVVNHFVHVETMIVLLSGTIFCALFGGIELGIAAAIVTALGHSYFFQHPTFHFGISSRRDGFDLALFLVMAMLMSWVGSLLRKARLEAQKAKTAMERTLALISHDIRNPIAGAKMATEISLRFYNLPEEGRKMAIKTIESLDRIDVMIQSLLDFHRIQSGKTLSLKFEPCDLKEVVLQTLKDLSLIHGDRLRFLPAKQLVGYWSSDGIRRAIENLVTNAVKYGSPSGLISIVLKEESNRVLLLVHNEGKAIPTSEQNTLFQFFNRASTAKDNQGWGLGLWIVKGIAEAHQGGVKIDSSAEAGTTFTIILPKQRQPLDARS